MKKRNLLSLLAFFLFIGLENAEAQTFVNKEWEAFNGIPDSIAYSSSVLDGQGNLIVTSNAITTGQDANLLVMKYDRNGNLLWQDNYNGTFNGKDYGIAVTTDNTNNVYVAGASQTGAISSDYIIRKYNATGTLQWDAIYNGSGTYNAPTAIAVDNSGNVYVTGVTFSFSTQMDYATLKFYVNGTQQWVATYNYANLYDVPAGIEVNSSTGTIYVTGASASSNNNYDYATIEYDATNGNQLNVNRVSAPGTGFDKATAIERDNAGNLYITGTAFNQNTNSYDIKTIKLNASIAVQWIQTYDKVGLEDAATTIDVDNVGNVFVGGYVSTTNEGRNGITLKYNASGSLIWEAEYNNSIANLDDEIRKIDLNTTSEVWVSGITDTGTETEILTIKYSADGVLEMLETYQYTPNGTNQATDIKTDNGGDVYVTGRVFDGTNYQNGVVKYATFENPGNVVFDSLNQPMYMTEQLIVKFNPAIVNTNFVDNTEKVFGVLNEVIPDSVITNIEQKTGISLRKSKISKIFLRMTTADSISISRLGENVKMPTFWSSFVITIPNTANLEVVLDSINRLPEIVEFAHPNWVGTLDNVPNDSYYADQHSLKSTTFSNAHINVEGAWDIQTGQNYVKVGVCDDPIFWANEDFGDGTYIGSKIAGGWDWGTNTHISNVTDPLSDHGTSCAGVIGALRNNSLGVAGIAGGDVDNAGNTGVQLFSMGILRNGSLLEIADCAAAIVEASTQTTNGFGYGLHILSNSYGFELGNPSANNGTWNNSHRNILGEAVRTSWENQCTFIASRGNDNNQDLKFPACYDDDRVLCVGASGENGERKVPVSASCANWGSSFGNEVDIIAPGEISLVLTTHQPTIPNSCFSYTDNNYQTFNGTSAAAPHVAGVAGLMLSEHNTVNGYPNNLSPDDVEQLIQIYGVDRDGGGTFPNGFDNQNGWGLLDAANVMQHLDMPNYQVLHSGIPNNTSQMGGFINQQISLPSGFGNLAAGNYMADRIDVTHTYLILLPSVNHSVIHTWSRPSSIVGLSAANPVFDKPFNNLTVTSVPGVVSVNAVSSCYFISTSMSGQTINQWIPAPPAQLKTTFSLHLYNNITTGIEQSQADISVFPIPFSDNITLKHPFLEVQNLKLEIVDMTGRVVHHETIANRQSNGFISVDLEKLSAGLYLCKLSDNEQTLVTKIVKE